jgi:hypothetical protein
MLPETYLTFIQAAIGAFTTKPINLLVEKKAMLVSTATTTSFLSKDLLCVPTIDMIGNDEENEEEEEVQSAETYMDSLKQDLLKLKEDNRKLTQQLSNHVKDEDDLF